jgi:hypothetical protein
MRECANTVCWVHNRVPVRAQALFHLQDHFYMLYMCYYQSKIRTFAPSFVPTSLHTYQRRHMRPMLLLLLLLLLLNQFVCPGHEKSRQ